MSHAAQILSLNLCSMWRNRGSVVCELVHRTWYEWPKLKGTAFSFKSIFSHTIGWNFWHQCLRSLLSTSVSSKQCRNISLGSGSALIFQGPGAETTDFKWQWPLAEVWPLLNGGLLWGEGICLGKEAWQIFQERELPGFQGWSAMMSMDDLAKGKSLIAPYESCCSEFLGRHFFLLYII